MHWYDDLPHIGYDINGKQVLRPARGDDLDKFLKTVDDPDAWYVYISSTLPQLASNSLKDVCI